MQHDVPSATQARPNFALAAPTCPICKSGMRFVQETPIVFIPGLVDVSYVCDERGQRTKRTFSRLGAEKASLSSLPSKTGLTE
jgi:hypothetical protein